MPTAAELAADQRFLTPWAAYVRDNRDPEGLHRVRVEVPGLIELSAWAYPLTNGGGSQRRGGHAVPHVGALVVVQFIGGDPEYPIYHGGWWAKGKAPTLMAGAGEEAHRVSVLELGQVVLTVDERERDADLGIGRLVGITDTITGDEITFDLDGAGITIKASSELSIKADGIVNIEGAQVQIQGRIVSTTTGGQI